jgi:hypothetical protein
MDTNAHSSHTSKSVLKTKAAKRSLSFLFNFFQKKETTAAGRSIERWGGVGGHKCEMMVLLDKSAHSSKWGEGKAAFFLFFFLFFSFLVCCCW